ncbi:MAG: polysaccharide biosynthesis/export family protein [Nitrospiraceae bacterium]
MTQHASRFTHHAITKAPFVIALVMLAALGCAGIPKALLDEMTQHPREFVLGPEDVLEVTVWRNQDLSRQVVIRPDGMISMPLLGDIQAGGLTAEQLAVRIGSRLKEYKENPSVSVTVKEVNSYNVYVLGEVTKPGKYQLKSHTTILQSIAMAGGFTPFASKNRMHVLRLSHNGDGDTHEIRIPVKYDDLVSGTGAPGNFFLRSGDTIVVP